MRNEILTNPFSKIESKYFKDSIPAGEQIKHYERLMKEIKLWIYSSEYYRNQFEHKHTSNLDSFFHRKYVNPNDSIIITGGNRRDYGSGERRESINLYSYDVDEKPERIEYEKINIAYNQLKVIKMKIGEIPQISTGNNTYDELLNRLKDLPKGDEAKKIILQLWKDHYLQIEGNSKTDKYYFLSQNSSYTQATIKKLLVVI